MVKKTPKTKAAKPKKEKKPHGRPTAYTAELAAEILERLSTGESLRAICKGEHMPDERTVRRWVVDNVGEFSPQYMRARDIALDMMADDILEIADTQEIGLTITEKPTGTESRKGDMIEHRRLRIDTRKWYLSKLAPKRYGDKVELSGPNGGAIPVKIVDDIK